MDSSVPLLERLKFLCISSTNLDEFFEIRVSGLKHRLAVNAAPAGPDNLSSERRAAHRRRASERARDGAVSRAQRRADPGAARRRHPLRPARRLVAGATQLARAVLPHRDRAALEPDDARSDSTVSAHPEQEPELHREPRRPRCVRPPVSSRDRAGAALAAAADTDAADARGNRQDGFRLPLVRHPRLRRSALRRHGDRRLLSVPRHAQQRSVHRRRGRRRLDDGARRRAVREPLRRGHAPRDGARLPGGARGVSARALQAHARRTSTKCRAPST